MSEERMAYRLGEAAEALGVSLSFVKVLIERGDLRAVRLSHSVVLIPRAELERLVG